MNHKIELLCVDVDGTLTDGSLVYGYSPCGDLSLDKHSADLLNFGRSQTSTLVSSLKTKFPRKFSKNNESHTENPSVVLGDKKNAESHESAKETITQITEISKTFNVKDGLALAYWRKILNRKVAIITGKSSEIVRTRAMELKIPNDLIFMGIRDKGVILRELKQRFVLDSSQIAAIGDDFNDIPMFMESALNFAPNDCTEAFKNSKDLPKITILNAKGGCGAVREAIEIILKKEQIYEAFVKVFV